MKVKIRMIKKQVYEAYLSENNETSVLTLYPGELQKMDNSQLIAMSDEIMEQLGEPDVPLSEKMALLNGIFEAIDAIDKKEAQK